MGRALTGPRPDTPRPGLLRDGRLARFFVTKTISALANGAGSVALPVFLLLDHGAAQMGLYLAGVTLVSLAVLPPAGRLADSQPRGTLIRVGYVLSAAAPLVLLAGDPGARLPVLGAAVLAGAGPALGSPATRAGLSDLVAPEKLAQVQGILSGIQNVVGIVSPALGGLALAVWSPDLMLAVQAGVFVLACLCTPRIPRPGPAAAAHGRGLPDGRSGAVRAILKVPWIRTGLVQTLMQVFLGFAPGLVLIRVVGVDRYGTEGLGLILATSAGAGLVGTVVAAVRVPRRPGLWANVGFVAYVPVFLCLAYEVPLLALVLAVAVGGIGISLHGVWWYVAINRAFRSEVRGRVNATDALATKLLEPVGMGLAVPATALVGLPAVALVGAATFLLAPALALLTSGFARYSADDEPASPDHPPTVGSR